MARRSSKVWEWPLSRSCEADANDNQDRFEEELVIAPFRPDEVDVQVNEGDLTIHCRHEREGSVPLELLRTYKLPEDVDPESVQTDMRDDGTLKVMASKRR